MTLPSSRAPLPPGTQRTCPVANNGKAFPQYCPASVRSFVTSSDVCLPISSSQSRICSGDKQHQQFRLVQHPLHPSLTIMNPCLWDDNTRLHACPNPRCLCFFTSQHAVLMPTGTDDDVRRNVELGTLLGKTVKWKCGGIGGMEDGPV